MSGSGAGAGTRAGSEAGATARSAGEGGSVPDGGGVREGVAVSDAGVLGAESDGSASRGIVPGRTTSDGAASEDAVPGGPVPVPPGATSVSEVGAGPGEGSDPDPDPNRDLDLDSGPGPRPGPARRRRWRAVRDAAYRNVLCSPGAVLSVLVLLLVLGWALAPEWFTHRSPTTGVPADRFRPPSGAHLFGTDQLGRDVYARVVHGASLSLRATVVAITVALVVGTLLGLASGYFGRWADAVIMRLVEVMLSVPPVLLSLTIVAAIGFGTVQVAVAVGVTSVAGFARVMRAEVLRVRTAGYVEATILLGSRWWRVLFRYVLPAAVGPVLALAALDFGLVVLAIAGLSFLGYGEPPPAPEWGALVADGRNYLATAWWLTALPSAVVSVVVLAANRLSRTLETRGERR